MRVREWMEKNAPNYIFWVNKWKYNIKFIATDKNKDQMAIHFPSKCADVYLCTSWCFCLFQCRFYLSVSFQWGVEMDTYVCMCVYMYTVVVGAYGFGMSTMKTGEKVAFN